MESPGIGERRLLSIVSPDKLRRVLHKMLDEEGFFGDYGIRSVSKHHAEHPYIFQMDGGRSRVDYDPGESRIGLFGGNSNWRGPVWFPVNFLIVESLQKFHYYLGNDYRIECPTGSGKKMSLWEISMAISHRLIAIFEKDGSGRRPVYGDAERFQRDPNWRDLVLFHEDFHGDTGKGLGASHQTGWTGLVAKLIQQCSEYCGQHKAPELLKKRQDLRAASVAETGAL
jgi:hypothetical protein